MASKNATLEEAVLKHQSLEQAVVSLSVIDQLTTVRWQRPPRAPPLVPAVLMTVTPDWNT